MNIKNRARRQAGFSLLELLLVVLLLTIVVAALFAQIERAQVRYRVEDQKLDLTQQEREFIDQFTRDLHQAGFPPVTVTGGQYTLSSLHAAAGVWYYDFRKPPVDENRLVLEGNIDVRQVNLSFKVDGRIDTQAVDEAIGSLWAVPPTDAPPSWPISPEPAPTSSSEKCSCGCARPLIIPRRAR